MSNRRRRQWDNRDRFPMNIVNAIRRFLGLVQHWLTTPLRWMMRERATRMTDRRPSIFRLMTYPFIWMFAYLLFAMGNAGDLIVSWSRSRPIRALMFGAPALIAVSTFLIILGFNYSTEQNILVSRYAEAASKAESKGRFDTARIYYQRLLQLAPNERRYDLAIALSYDKEEKGDEAEKRMRKLLKYPEIAAPVNYWMAQKTLKRDDVDDHTKWIVARGHVRKYLARNPKDFQGNKLGKQISLDLANAYSESGEFADAIDALKETESNLKVIADYDSRSLLELAKIQSQLAELHTQVSMTTQANAYAALSLETANRSIAYFQKQLDNQFDSIKDLLGLSDSLLFIKQYERALRPLDAAIKNDKSKKLAPKLTPYKSKVYAVWAQEIMDQNASSLAKSFELVEKSLALDPNNETATVVLARISLMNEGKVSTSAKQKLDEKLNLDSAIDLAAAPFVVHMILGSDAAAKGNNEVAVRHLRQALIQNRNASTVLNNLAYVLARLENPQFDEALSLINNALKISPGNPRFLDTRGGIYLLLKQYEFAFRDLENAELSIRNNPLLYQKLVFLSKTLGFEKHEKRYSRRLEQLRAAIIQADLSKSE